MKIYTKTGDKGETSLFGGKRVPKFDIAVAAVGDVDELNSFIGYLIAILPSEKEIAFLTEIQTNLYQVMSLLSGYEFDHSELKKQVPTFEKRIDEVEKNLPKLTTFILPQGGEVAAFFQICRTICRRAERSVVELFSQAPGYKQEEMDTVGKYLNRLSDLLFVLARNYHRDMEITVARGKKLP